MIIILQKEVLILLCNKITDQFKKIDNACTQEPL